MGSLRIAQELISDTPSGLRAEIVAGFNGALLGLHVPLAIHKR